MENIKYSPIGIIHSPFREPNGVPIQSIAAKGIKGTVEVFPEYAEGLSDLGGFSYIYLLCHFHMSKKPRLKVIPFLDKTERGVFSTRAPGRPNPIGLSIVQLLKVEGNILHIADLDIIDGTPVLDIKPYIPEVDIRKQGKTGWLTRNIGQMSTKKDDGRFRK